MSMVSSELCPFKLEGYWLASPLSPHRSWLWSLLVSPWDKLVLTITPSWFHALPFASSSSLSERLPLFSP